MRTAEILFVMVGILLNGPAMAQGQERKSSAAASENTTTSREDSFPGKKDENYIIGPLDVLAINVWKEPEFSRTVPVRPDGKISLPLINDIQASGLTPIELGAAIQGKLKRYVTNPSTTVIVQEAYSKRVYILGEVARPGAYPLTTKMTVLQALATAGGFREFAKVKDIFLLRNINGERVKFPFNYKEVLRGTRPEQDIFLRAGDTIIVP